VRPIPVDVHIGPLQLHTYGFGLAVTFYFAYWYLGRRLRANGFGSAWLGPVAVWVIVAALVGARIVHVVANISYYAAQPVQVLEVWHGGLSSFGGLLGGVPTGFLLARRRAPGVPLRPLADLAAPVLMAAWGLGRLLGPQLMVAGGGHPTHQWFGMYYAGQVGRRLPVPVFQALISFGILLVAWQVERYAKARPVQTELSGLVMAVTVGCWGLGRFCEEHLWLAYPGNTGAVAVQAAGASLCCIGFATAGWLLLRGRRQAAAAASSATSTPRHVDRAPV